jgi:O-antigen/teichoic acid export membrane protein
MAARLRDRSEVRPLSALFSTALWVNAAFAVLFVLAGSVLLLVLPNWRAIPPGRADLARGVFLIMIARGALSFPIRVAANMLVGLQMQAFVNLLNAAGTILAPVVYVALLYRNVGLIALPIGVLAGTVVTSLPTFLLLKRAVPEMEIGWRHVTFAEARMLFRWSTLFFLNNISVIIIYYTSNIVIASCLDLVAVTRFALTSSLILYWQPFVVAVSDSAMPACVELYKLGELERLRAVFLQMMRMALGAVFCVAVTAGTANRFFVNLWVGGGIYGGDFLSLAFAVILVHRTAMQVSSVIVISTGRIRGVALMSMVEAACNLALSLLLAKPLGILGVALGTSIAALATSGWYVPRVLLQEIRTGLWQYFRECWAPPILASAAALTAAILMRMLTRQETWTDLTAFAGTVCVIYVAVFLLLEAQRGDWRQWARMLRTATVPSR